MATWRYAVNNLRRAVDLLPEEQRQMHKSTVSLVAQISSEIDAFFQQPTAEAMVVGVSNARMLFDALKDWMINSPPSFMELPDDTTVGLDFLPGQRALRISADPETHPGEVEVRQGFAMFLSAAILSKPFLGICGLRITSDLFAPT